MIFKIRRIRNATPLRQTRKLKASLTAAIVFIGLVAYTLAVLALTQPFRGQITPMALVVATSSLFLIEAKRLFNL